ncbi:MAG: FAD-dependent oxidoreductase [Candidatus Atribacteria bacterium]|nr:FAD-dependent oxidoreductase [Candidatus Atribacteria bacterium]
MNTYDVIIIGGGAGGMTAGIYTSREMLSTLLIEKKMVGGLAAETELIENYPGFPEGITGMDLMNKMKDQAQKFGVEIIELEEVESIKPTIENKIIVRTVKHEYRAYSVIVASGTVPKSLNVPGEKEFRGKGISYCATCDGPLYRDKEVAVIGCGNSGLQEGESLLKHARGVTFVEFLPYMTASKILQQRVKKNKKTTFFLNHTLVRIDGNEFVESITLKNRDDGQKKKLKVSGVFLYVGFLPTTDFLEEAEVELDKKGYIKTDDKMETSVPGIYAVGDIRSKIVRQIDIACGEATIAAITAFHRIQTLETS